MNLVVEACDHFSDYEKYAGLIVIVCQKDSTDFQLVLYKKSLGVFVGDLQRLSSSRFMYESNLLT